MTKGQVVMYRCIQQGGGFVEIKGQEVHFHYDELVPEGSPLLKACPDFFERTDMIRSTTEAATAGPGEQRGA